MRYAIIAYGSRGDVQPFIALALELMERRHQAILLAPENFKGLIQEYGVNFYPLHGNAEELLYSPEGRRAIKSGKMFTLLRYLQKGGRKIQHFVNSDIMAGCAGSDALITNVLCMPTVRAVAEKFNKRWAMLSFHPPTTATKEFPFIGLSFYNSPGYNLFTYWLLTAVYWQLNKKDFNQFRKSIGLDPLKRPSLDKKLTTDILNLYCISPHIIVRPSDWPVNTDITGFLTLPQNKPGNNTTSNPDNLKAWIQKGEKPVYIGFGSIPVPDPVLLSGILNEIILHSKYRVIFCRGWSIVPDLPVHPRLLTIEYADHDWLFPQCSTVIFHGGAGTLATVLRAKTPFIILSVFADQPWWGHIAEEKKIGVHIPFKKITTEKILHALTKAQADTFLRNLNEIGEIINQENGVMSTADRIEEYFCDEKIKKPQI